MTVGPGKLIGLQEIRQNQPFIYGTLMVDEEGTTLCYINRINFMREIEDYELDNLIDSPSDCARFPEEEDIYVERRAKKELQQIRSRLLLDAIGKNQVPLNSRSFDAKFEQESPTKGLNKWCEQFGASLKPRNNEIFVQKVAKVQVPTAGKRLKSRDEISKFVPANDDRKLEKYNKQELLKGSEEWEITPIAFKSGEKARVKRVQ